MTALLIVLGAAVLLVLAFFALGSAAFFRNRKLADLQWSGFVPRKLAGLGSVRKLTITPLVDWYVNDGALRGEAGVSWLVRADDTTILMDVGLNLKGEDPSPLLRNMEKLNIHLEDVPYVFISHRHVDHTGGLAPQKARTFMPSPGQTDLSEVIAFVPVPMRHATAEVRLIEGPQVLMPGIASEGPIARSIYGLGLTMEQALVVNVAGKGLVIIVGCGHQGLTRIIERAEMLFNEPIYGFVAGLHYPVTGSRLKRFGLPLQKFLGTGKLPWQRVTREDVRQAIAFLKSRKPQVVSISGHDSCDWTLQEFRNAFKDSYRDLKVGLPLVF